MSKFRQNVAIVAIGQSGKMLVCQRADIAGAIQIPQGGIEDGETPEEAMHRELFEEVGAKALNVIAKMPKSISYIWPEHLHKNGYIGQEQIYFLVEIDESKPLTLGPKDNPEFSNSEWMKAEDFLFKVSGFKKEAYKAGVSYFLNKYPQYFKTH